MKLGTGVVSEKANKNVLRECAQTASVEAKEAEAPASTVADSSITRDFASVCPSTSRSGVS